MANSLKRIFCGVMAGVGVFILIGTISFILTRFFGTSQKYTVSSVLGIVLVCIPAGFVVVKSLPVAIKGGGLGGGRYSYRLVNDDELERSNLLDKIFNRLSLWLMIAAFSLIGFFVLLDSLVSLTK